MTEKFKTYLRNYWNYYRELEDEFMETRRYVEINEKNFKTFSIEYLKLYQAVCSEVDVVGKIIATSTNPGFKTSDTKNNIVKWWFEIQDTRIRKDGVSLLLEDYDVLLLDEIKIVPWQNFHVERHMDEGQRVRYKISDGKATPTWWKQYNGVKHGRTLSEQGAGINYYHANLGNLVYAFAGLYVLEMILMQINGIPADIAELIDMSVLFSMKTTISADYFENLE